MRRVIERTPLVTHLRSRSLVSFDLAPDNVFELWVERLAANGFRRAMVFDSLHDTENLRFSTRIARANGLEVTAVLFYTISPFHTPGYYAAKAAEVASVGADAMCLRDPSGLLTPERTRELVTIIRRAVPDLPLELKSHCNTGQAEDCYVEAALHGVDRLFVATAPMSGGVSVPSARSVAERLAERGIDVGVDVGRLADEETYFHRLADRGQRVAAHASTGISETQHAHQLPGNMLAFTRDQLRTMNLEHKMPEVLEEFPRVRADMGYPVMVTPISQLVCVQAVLNVLQGERYKSIPMEVRKFVHGAYGRPEAPLAPELLERGGRHSSAPLTRRTGSPKRAKHSGHLSQTTTCYCTCSSGPSSSRVSRCRRDAAVLAAPVIGMRSLIDVVAELAAQGGLGALEARTRTFSFIGRRYDASGAAHPGAAHAPTTKRAAHPGAAHAPTTKHN